jgi:hypothetical protein
VWTAWRCHGVQSLAQSEDYRNPLSAILYTHGSNNFPQSENLQELTLCNIVCPWAPIAFTKWEPCCNPLCAGFVYPGVKSFAHEWNHLQRSGVLQPTLCSIVCTEVHSLSQSNHARCRWTTMWYNIGRVGFRV